MRCPNELCPNHNPIGSRWFVKYGYFTPKTTGKKTPRYKCTSPNCGKIFSTHTGRANEGQKKPEINVPLFKMLVSGVSLRRAALILDVDYNTVLYHFDYLAEQAKLLHAERLKTIATSFVQVDELETFLHARSKALSVPMVVRYKTKEILAFSVARKPANGKMAAIGAAKYNWIVDERAAMFMQMIKSIDFCFKPIITIRSDSKSVYKTWIKNAIPHAEVDQVLGGGVKPVGSYDELFAINNTFARMRHDMNRLARKTWSTTKSISGLEKHIWLFVAWNNKYKIR